MAPDPGRRTGGETASVLTAETGPDPSTDGGTPPARRRDRPPRSRPSRKPRRRTSDPRPARSAGETSCARQPPLILPTQIRDSARRSVSPGPGD